MTNCSYSIFICSFQVAPKEEGEEEEESGEESGEEVRPIIYLV